MKRSEVDRNKLSPMMAQYMEIKDNYEDTIIFFRLGDFYEMFFEDAIIGNKELELTLTGKQAGLDERIPMCGIPYHAYKNYVEKLVNLGYKVAICEQLEDPKNVKGMVKRDVIQVVTKGTIIDDSLNANDNNYIGNIYDFEYCYVITYTDISTGEFYAYISDEDHLIKDIISSSIKELIVNSKLDRSLINTLREIYHVPVTIYDDIYEEDDYKYIYTNIADVRIVLAIKHLLSYVLANKKGDLSHLQEVQIVNKKKHLLFSQATKRNLELVETLKNHEKMYSLLWLLDKAKTAMGSRLLKQNIENPLLDKNELERRYNIIEHFRNEFILREELINNLNNVYDLERLASRITYGNLNAKDLISLKNSLKVLPNIRKILTDLKYDKNVIELNEITDLLDQAINDDCPYTIKEGGIIKDGYNSDLDELRSIKNGSKDFLISIEEEEKKKTGIKNLKVGFNKIFGYYIEISKGNIPLIKDEYGYIRKQTLTTGERFITPLLKEKENIILGAEEKINNLEYLLFMDIREKVKDYIGKIQKNAKIIAEVDMLSSLAVIAEENGYVRPNIVNNNNLKIVDGRHPVIEKVMKHDYIPNDIIMGSNTNILLITGPNMAGKSTYMRQLAIIVIMAQIGSFVPCKICEMPLFDQIFTRIGASDDLVSGESTFMVEMKEANDAISSATCNSLILFDELGRGTATYDGMSLAQAILEYIHDTIKCKTLFSTHYHELTSLASDLPNLKNIHVQAIEEDGNITFLHKIKSGAIDKSYGIHVASLAKLPKKIITRADEVLNVYEHKNKKNIPFTQTSLFCNENEKAETKNPIIEKIKTIDPINITPLEALNILYELKNEIKQIKE